MRDVRLKQPQSYSYAKFLLILHVKDKIITIKNIEILVLCVQVFFHRLLLWSRCSCMTDLHDISPFLLTCRFQC